MIFFQIVEKMKLIIITQLFLYALRIIPFANPININKLESDNPLYL